MEQNNTMNVSFHIYILKGQSNKIFYLQFFSSFEPDWATDQRVKYFCFWFSLRRDIRILV